MSKPFPVRLQRGLLLALVLIVLRVAPARAQEARQAPEFEPAECPFVIPQGENVECGYVLVPERHDVRDSPRIRLGVAVLKSHSVAPRPDPFIQLNGGPAGYAVPIIPQWMPMYRAILAARDVIVYDQRGSGWSQPRLDCPELDSGNTREGFLACRDRLLAQGIDLAAFSTAENTADVRDVWQALGYTRVNLYGVSYGTILAQNVLREYPDAIRSVVLDSFYPLGPGGFDEGFRHQGEYMQTVFAGCAADWICAATYPDLAAVYRATVLRLRAAPVPLVTGDPATGAARGITLDEDAFIAAILQSHFRGVPALVYEVHDGEYGTFLDLVRDRWRAEADRRPRLDSAAMGTRASVLCSDSVLRMTPEQLAAPLAGADAEAYRRVYLANAFALTLCDQWPAHEPAPREFLAPAGDVPALLLLGQYDAGTPPDYIERLGHTLTRHYAYVVPGMMHGVVPGGGACALTVMLAFLDRPEQAPDAACFAALGSPGLDTAFTVRASAARRPAVLLLAGLGLVLAVYAWRGGRGLAARRFTGFTWRYSLRYAPWPFAVGSALAALAVFWLVRAGWLRMIPTETLVALIVPAVAAIQAAFIFSPEDEPALEVQLAAGRPLAWTVLERLACLVALQGLAAAASGFVAGMAGGEGIWIGVSRWIAPLIFLPALGVYLTVATRRPVASMSVVSLLCFVFVAFGESMLHQWPFTWPLQLYLAPDHPDYLLNRLLLIGLGLVLAFAAARLTRDEERLLWGARRARESAARPARGTGARIPALAMPAGAARLGGLIHYELVLLWRRSPLGIVVGGLAIVPLLGVLFGHEQFAGYAAALAAGTVAEELVAERITAAMMLPTWLGVSTAALLLVPLAAAEIIPKDRGAGVYELLDSLPLRTAQYLTGKLAALWLALLGITAAVAVVNGVLWRALVGPFDLWTYAGMWALIAAWLLVQGTLSAALAASQPSVKRAVAVGAVVALVCLIGYGLGLAQPFQAALEAAARGELPRLDGSGIAWHVLNPGRPGFLLHEVFGRPGDPPAEIPARLTDAMRAVLPEEVLWWSLAGGILQSAAAWLVAWAALRRRPRG